MIKSEKEYMLEELRRNMEVNYEKAKTNDSNSSKGLKINFANYDKKVKGIEMRTYDIEKITFEVLEERIKQGIDGFNCYSIEGYDGTVKSMALEVLKLAPYMSEEEVKNILINNRVNEWIKSPKNPRIEGKAISKAEKNASKKGFSIPKVGSLTTNDFDKLIFGIWNPDQIGVIGDKLHATYDQKIKGLTDEEKMKQFEQYQSQRPKSEYNYDKETGIMQIMPKVIKSSLASVTRDELEVVDKETKLQEKEKENENEKEI